MKSLIPLHAVFVLCFALGSLNINHPAQKDNQKFQLPVTLQKITPPHFPGGEKAFSKFLDKNLKWPDNTDGQGTVIAGFLVETSGKLTHIHIVKSVAPEFDAEAVRVMQLSPKWVPAFSAGKPVKSKYTIPINFN